MNFVGTLTAIFIIDMVTELSYSVFSTIKRVVIIFGALIYFNNPISLQAMLGTFEKPHVLIYCGTN